MFFGPLRGAKKWVPGETGFLVFFPFFSALFFPVSGPLFLTPRFGSIRFIEYSFHDPSFLDPSVFGTPTYRGSSNLEFSNSIKVEDFVAPV
jgi:hypothetical protein